MQSKLDREIIAGPSYDGSGEWYFFKNCFLQISPSIESIYNLNIADDEGIITPLLMSVFLNCYFRS